MFVLVIGALASISAYAVLMLARSQALQARFYRERVRGRYTAEAGIVWAQQRLWNDPTYCGSPDPPVMDGLAIDVSVTNCGVANTHVISSKVTY
jgi:hypothetical protein